MIIALFAISAFLLGIAVGVNLSKGIIREAEKEMNIRLKENDKQVIDPIRWHEMKLPIENINVN